MAFKFNIGDFVRVDHPTLGYWEGKVYRRNDTGEGLEYWVTNAPQGAITVPCLAWESEMTLIEKK